MSFATDVKSSSELLKGKWVLITGASKGVGEGIAVTFAKHGACVALVARSQDKLEEVGLTQAGGLALLVLMMHLSLAFYLCMIPGQSQVCAVCT